MQLVITSSELLTKPNSSSTEWEQTMSRNMQSLRYIKPIKNLLHEALLVKV